MGQRGPRPQPNQLKIERGNPGKRAINTEEPELRAADNKPPAGLSRGGKTYWKKLAHENIAAGVLTVADEPLFVIYCNCLARCDWLEKIVRRNYPDAKKLGYVRDLKEFTAQARSLAAELGQSPTSRSSVKRIKGKKATDEKRSRFFGDRRQVTA